MYDLPSRFAKPGTAFADIVRHRVHNGSLQADPARYCAEVTEAMAVGKAVSMIWETRQGRAISIVNRPIPGSSYWVGTHDDITERRAAERQSTLLGEQRARRAAVDEAITWFRGSVEGVLQTVAGSVGGNEIDGDGAVGDIEGDDRAHCRRGAHLERSFRQRRHRVDRGRRIAEIDR